MADFNRIWQIAGRKVASVLGQPYSQYRPAGVGAALAAGNLVGVPPVWFSADDALTGEKPLPQNKSRGFAACDPAVVFVGDYLVGQRWTGGPVETWFVESFDIPAAASVVRCNRTLTFTRPAVGIAGDENYGGAFDGNEVRLLTSWPVAMEEGPRGQTGDTDLPSDPRLPWVKLFLPAPDGVQFRSADRATDNEPMPMSYIIVDALSTQMGWRLTAQLVQT